MESKHENKPSGLKVHTGSGTNRFDHITTKKKHSRSPSSSPDSPFDDPFSDSELNEYKKSTNLDSETTIKLVPPTTNNKPPPNQAMERPEYRIPSHVFARTKSTAPKEWSVASNDSLFSINVGESSFGRDSMFNYNVPDKQQSPKVLKNVPCKASDDQSKGDDKSDVETEKSSNESLFLPPSVSSQSLSSDISISSVNSFAFPILTGNNGKDGCLTRGGDSTRIGFGYFSQQLKPTTPTKNQTPQPKEQPQQLKASSSQWFGCFTCCTGGSK